LKARRPPFSKGWTLFLKVTDPPGEQLYWPWFEAFEGGLDAYLKRSFHRTFRRTFVTTRARLFSGHDQVPWCVDGVSLSIGYWLSFLEATSPSSLDGG